MTWFLEPLDRESRAEPRERTNIRGGDAAVVAGREAVRTEDYWGITHRRRAALMEQMVERMGGPDVLAPDQPDADPAQQMGGIGPRPERRPPARALDEQLERLFEQAGPAAARDPARWGDLPLTREQFDGRIKAGLKSEIEEARDILAGHDGWLAPLLGQMAVFATDREVLPFWLAGGHPSRAASFILRETVLGAAAEIATLPKAQRQAALLELEEPNALERIGMGALAGGVLGGTIAAGARGIEYLRLRNRQEAAAAPGPEAASAAQRAERDIRAGQEPEVPPPAIGDMADADIVARIIGIESGGRATAQNPLSSARGLGQFIAGTWMDMITRHRPDLVAGRTRAEVLVMRDDPDLNRAMTTIFMQENRARLQAAGVPTDPGALYLAHFMGAGGAIRALRAAPGTPISALMTPAEIRANAGVRWSGRSFAQFTAADLRSWSSGRMGAAPSGRAPAAATAAADDPGGGSGPPGQRFDFGQSTSRPMTRFDEVVTPAGTRVPVEYRVVDLDSLTPARGEFQPRDRTRAGSDEQVAEIAARLDAMRLMPSPEADRGAPIVGPDMMVESGNGRVMALRRAADQHPDRFDAYREAITAAGFEVPEGMSRPALVAMRRGDMTDAQRRAFVAEANDSGTMRMAATEQAGRDADFLSGPVMDAYQPGQPVAQQGEFLRRIMGQMSQSERAAMIGADGRLNADGLRRVRQALFARAYGAPDLLRVLAESPDPRLRAMLEMLDELAPDWAAFRARVDAGAIRPEFDITETMIDMVRTIARARTEGRDGQSVIAAIRDRMAQGDMFAAPDTDLAEALLAAFYRNTRARRPVDTGDILRRYIADAHQVGGADDLFGAVPPVEVLQAAVRNHEARTEYALPGPRAEGDVTVPALEATDPAPMLDGAASPVLVRADDATEDAMRAAVAPAEDVRELLAAARRRLAARDEDVARLSADQAPVRFSKGADDRALVSQSPDRPGRWRVSYLDQSGPVGHSDFDNKADAVRRALEEGLEPVAPPPTPATGGEAAAAAAAAREYEALRDLSVRMDPEGPEVRVADLLDDLRDNATLSDAVASCVTRRGG